MNIKGKKKVVHVLKSSIYSGAENVALTIINGLKEEFDCIYIATEGPIREKLEQEGISFVLLKEFNRKNLKKTLAELKPDIIHAHDFSATVMCILCGEKRIISHLHYDPPWAREWNLKTLTYAVLARRISRILAVSRGAYNNLIFSRKFFYKTDIIGNPIDKERILSMGEGNQDIKYDLLFVGRLVEQKAPGFFIEIVKMITKKGLDVHCAMLGTGELEGECQKQIKKENLQNNIEMLGFQKNPYQYMKKSKILCMTSQWEGYGLVAAEANILGIPVLSTKTGGVTEIFGIDAEELCDNLEEFTEKIEMLLSDPKQYQRWQENAKKRSKEFVEPEEYIEKLRIIYKKEIESR